MSAATRRSLTRGIAGAGALALAMLPSAAAASDFPLEPRDSENSVAQSVQIRVNADGTPNSNVTNFRWSVTQLTAAGEPNTELTVRIPEQGKLLHSLQEFGTIPQEDGQGVFTIDLNDTGFGTARSVSLYPPSMDELPVELRAEFTLDGEPILAEDLVGKDGLVTATYTVTNTTRQALTVPITSVTGDEVEKEVEADVPLVVEAATLLPQTYGGLNVGTGLGGADGRGNWQVKWIALPFSPLSKDGSASFGWAANVTDAVIPAMLIQVLPIFIPEGGEDDGGASAEDVAAAGERLGVAPPDVSGEVAGIKSGVEDVISGIETLTADDGGEDPLTVVEGKVNEFFTEFGANIETISTLLDPNNPEGAAALVNELQGQVVQAQETIDQVEQSGVIDRIDSATNILTPQTAQQLADLAGPLNDLADSSDQIKQLADNADRIQALADNADNLLLLADNADRIKYLADNAETIKAIADNAALIANGINLGCINPPGPTEPALPPEVCDNKAAIIAILESDELQQISQILNSSTFQQAADILASDQFARAASIIASDEFQTAADVLSSDEFQKAADVVATDQFATAAAALAKAAPVLVPVAEALQLLDTQLPGIITTLKPVLAAIDTVLADLEAALSGLSEQLRIIGQGLAEKNVNLPTLDSVLAEVTAQILASPGGQQVTGGLDQIGGGIAGVKAEIGAYVAELAVALQAAKAQVDEAVAEGKQAAGAVIEKADTLKAEVAGLVTAAHQSPLPYGGDPADAPEGTKLAGAYEFRLDPADHEAPSTLPRLLISIVLLVGAGLLGNWAARRKLAGATAGAGGAGGAAAGGTPAGWAPWGTAAGATTATAAIPLATAEPEPTAPTAGDAAPETPTEAGDAPGGDGQQPQG
jgi:hypothetical protein